MISLPFPQRSIMHGPGGADPRRGIYENVSADLLYRLCFQEVIQERYHEQLFSVLIPTLEDHEPRFVFNTPCRRRILLIVPDRVHSHAAAALINFCEGVECKTLLPYLDPIVERLLKLLNLPNERRYVQEQAITTLAMVADASEATFAKVGSLSRCAR